MTAKDVRYREVVDTYQNEVIRFRVVFALMWYKPNKSGDCDAFFISLHARNADLMNIAPTTVLDSGGWTEIAHSDHDPNSSSGHDIYDSSDSKQLHVDINQKLGDGYTKTFKRIAGGKPPHPTGKAANVAADYLERNCSSFLQIYLR